MDFNKTISWVDENLNLYRVWLIIQNKIIEIEKLSKAVKELEREFEIAQSIVDVSKNVVELSKEILSITNEEE